MDELRAGRVELKCEGGENSCIWWSRDEEEVVLWRWKADEADVGAEMSKMLCVRWGWKSLFE